MKRLVLAGITFGVLAAGPAFAADMSVKAPIMKAPPPPVFSWTGCYIAGGGGYGFWDQETSATRAFVTTPTQDGAGRGWFGTAQVGCDYELSTPIFGSSIVIGAQGDWNWGDLKGTDNFAFDNIGDEKNKWTWAAGGRIGYVFGPRSMAYVSGGYTQAHFDRVDFSFDETGGVPTLFIPDNTYHGWYIGSGYEYGLTFLPGLFWKTEYRYSEFSAADLAHIVIVTGLPNGVVTHSKKFEQTIRSELVWRFNWFH
jgi:outer membrane immunogenic protein